MLEGILKSTHSYEPIKGIRSDSFYTFDLSEKNEDLAKIDMNNKSEFESYIFNNINSMQAKFGIGKYAENRILYRRFGLFESKDSRSFHIGFDVWANAGTAVYAPFDATVHSFANNSNPGDYGPTIILKHKIEQYVFYTLYGHLSEDSIENITIGDFIKAGDLIAHLGKWEVNKYWPPHLHFQIIKDLYKYSGDFPGVCTPDSKVEWMENCPNPNLILKIPGLA